LVIGFILFEAIEHIGIPIVFYFLKRKKKSITGIESLLGEVVEIVQWKETEGQVFIKGELGKALSDVPLKKGEKAIVQSIEGLTLKLKLVDKSNRHK
jgi:membrane-bound ClpP family serine protease